jgi:arylsulfatase A-like enzyme
MWIGEQTNAPKVTLCCSLWLAVALTICKGVLLGLPSQWSRDGVVSFTRDLAVMAHADILFAAVVGLLSAAAIHLNKKRTASRSVIAMMNLLVCTVSVLYGIVSVQVFAYLRSHLTYPLIYLAGDMKNMRSSLGAFLTLPMMVALVTGPALYLGLVWASQRFITARQARSSRAAVAFGLAVVAVYVPWGHFQYTSLPWCDRVDRRVAENAHWVLMKSFVVDLFSDGHLVPLGLDENFAPESLEDFETIAERLPAVWALGHDHWSRPLGDLALASDRTDSLRIGAHARSPFRVPGGPIGSTSSEPWTLRPMNVIVYVLESVGTQHLNLYGSPYDTTPSLNRESASALVFDNFYAHCGVTANSLVAINLGIYPGLTWREYTVEQPDLPGTTLAEILRARGYRTAYMTSGEIQYVNMDGFLRNRGYDLVCGYEFLGCRELIMSWGVEDRCLVDALFRWIDQDGDVSRPFYAMVWNQQTHHPYEPSPGVPFIDFFEGLGEAELPPDDYDLGRYLNVVREADRQLGRLFDELRRRGLAENTLVVVTGDHGEGFGAPHDIYGHGGRVFDEIAKVPLVIWNPRLFHPGRRVHTIAGHIDLNPTLAEWLGVGPAGCWQGRSLFDPRRAPRAYFYAANDDYLLAVREEGWKYIYNATIAREQLFDLIGDPQEQKNIAATEPKRCESMRRRLAAWMHYEQQHIAKLRAARLELDKKDQEMK